MKSRRDGIKRSRKKDQAGEPLQTIYCYSIHWERGSVVHTCLVLEFKVGTLEEERKELTNTSQRTKMHVCLAAQKKYICVGIGRMNDQK